MTQVKHTIQQLIEDLQALLVKDPTMANAEVMLDGCDCTGKWSGNIDLYDRDGKFILLLR